MQEIVDLQMEEIQERLCEHDLYQWTNSSGKRVAGK